MVDKWISTFDDTFFLTLAGIVVGLVGLSIRFCYRSKCKTIDCWGLHIVRDVENEEKLDEMEIQYHGTENVEEIKDNKP
jgi:hypothetical protein